MTSIWLFADCSPKELRFIDSLCVGADVPDGRTLLRQGDCAAQFLVIARGTAVAAVDRRPIALIEAGSFCGDMALLGPGVQRATVSSATHMELLVFSRQEGTCLFEAGIPSVQDKILAVLAERRRVLTELALETQESFALDQLGDLPALQHAAI